MSLESQPNIPDKPANILDELMPQEHKELSLIERAASIRQERAGLEDIRRKHRHSIPDNLRRSFETQQTVDYIRGAREKRGLPIDGFASIGPTHQELYEEYTKTDHELFKQDHELERELSDIYRADSEVARQRLIEILKEAFRQRLRDDSRYEDALRKGEEYNPLNDTYEYNMITSIEDERYGVKGEHYPREKDPYVVARQEVLEELNAAATASTPLESGQDPVPELIRQQIIKKDLAYQDTELPDELRDQMLAWSQSSPSANRYAESVARAGAGEGIESIRKTATKLRDRMLSEAARLAIPVGPHGRSVSWAMWDIGKQYHYFTHPEERQSGYDIANPLTSEEKQEEIVSRHLGWEAYAAYQKDSAFRQVAQNEPQYAAALPLLNKPPKENATLSSYDLAFLGKQLRGL